jgi:ATP-binding cassette, subfamily B, bacterial
LISEAVDSGDKKRLFWKRLAGLARPMWLQLLAIILLSFLATPLALLSPLPLKIAVDSVLSDAPVPHWLSRILPLAATTKRGELFVAAGLLLGVAILVSLQSLATWLLQTYTGERMVHDFRGQLLWHVQRLSLAFHDRRGPNDTTYRIQHDAPSVQNILIQGFVPLVTSAFGFVAMLWVTACINWQLAIIAILLSPVLFLLARNSSRKVRAGYDEVKELDSSAMLVMHEALSCVRAVKAFVQEGYEDELFRRKSRMRMVEQIRLASIQASFHVFIGLTIALGTAAALVVGVSQVLQGRISIGELLLVMAYMAQLYEPLRTISTKIPELQSAIVSAERAFSLLDEDPEPAGSGSSLLPQRVKGEIEFQQVCFQYTSGRKVLDNINFRIPAGSCVGIVGPSGSGKSTLVNLLTRFYEPLSGQVLLDGVDLRNYKLTDLRRQFSIVLQEPMLFSTTVAGNIAYAKPCASRAEVVEAGRLANAHDFIMRLPKGYDTPIGEGGARLSGGERQRLAIARAFLNNAPLIVLDEPTSAVDIRTEAVIMEAIEKLMKNRTTFMIAHRLSTLEKCDVVLVMKEGRLNMITSDLAEAKMQLMQTEATPGRTNIAPLGPVLVN